jgi:hypothetical protein
MLRPAMLYYNFNPVYAPHACRIQDSPPSSYTLPQQPPSPSTINTNSIVRPNADTQTTRILIVAPVPVPISSPVPIPIASAHSLALTPLRLYDQPRGTPTIVFLLHELQLWSTASPAITPHIPVPLSSSHIPIPSPHIGFAEASVVAATFSAWLLRLGGRWWVEEGVELRGFDREGGDGCW